MTATAPREVKPAISREPMRNRMAYGLTSLLVVVVAGLGIWWFGFRSVAGPVDSVEDSIAALNDADVSAALEAYASDVTPADLSLLTLPTQTVREFFEYSATTNERTTVVEACEEYVADVVQCTLRHEDDLMRAAGLAPVLTHTYRMNDEGLITQENVTGDGTWEYLDFYTAYARWLVDAHPDAYVEVFGQGERTADEPGTQRVALAPLLTAETAPILLEHIDEFVAESDLYPVS